MTMCRFTWLFMFGFSIYKECSGINHNIDDKPIDQFGKTLHGHVFRESNAYLFSHSNIEKRNRAPHDHLHEVVFVIQQKNVDELTSILYDISDPHSPNYGQNWTREKVADFTSNAEGRDAVVSYLHLNGASVISETLAGEYIIAKAPIKIWEEILNTEFFSLILKGPDKSTKTFIRAESYCIPRDLDMHVAGVLNAVEVLNQPFNPPSRIAVASRTDENSTAEFGYMTPIQLRVYYNMSSAMSSMNSTQGIYTSLRNYQSSSDSTTFQISQGLPFMPAILEQFNRTDGTACSPFDPRCTEGNPDRQYSNSVTPTTYRHSDSWYIEWLIEVANSTNLPKVLSVGYISSELGMPISVQNSFNTMAIKLGTMGVTVVAPSGDDGSNFPGRCGYYSVYPAASPYVLSVGATMVSQVLFLTVFAFLF